MQRKIGGKKMFYRENSVMQANQCSCGRQRQRHFICPECKGNNTTLSKNYDKWEMQLNCLDCAPEGKQGRKIQPKKVAGQQSYYLYRFKCQCGATGIGHHKNTEWEKKYAELPQFHKTLKIT